MRRVHRNRTRGLSAICILLVGILVFLSCVLVFLDKRLRPQLYALAAIRAYTCAEESMNEAVLNTLNSGNCETLVHILQNECGDIISVQTDALEINLLKGRIANAACSALNERTQIIPIPIGSVSGLDILSGMGPRIKIKVHSMGFASAEIQSSFESAGINQTIHRLRLKVNATICLSMAKMQESKRLSYDLCIAETILVGSVPNFYANTGNGES